MIKKSLIAFLIFFCLSGIHEADAQKLKDLWNKAKSEVKKATKKKEKEIANESGVSSAPNSEKEKKESEEPILNVDFGPIIAFKAPNNNFESFEMQSFNGLLRFGKLNNFKTQRDKAKKIPDYRTTTAIDNKVRSQIQMMEKFRYLSEIKYLKEWYDVMDRDYFTMGEEVNNARPRNNGEDQTEYNRLSNSQKAQLHIKSAAFSLVNKLGKNTYFCNSERGDCIELEDNVFRTDENGRKTKVRSGIGAQWGGSGSSEFAQLRNYKAFTKDHLSTLQKWGNSLWNQGFQEAYFVSEIQHGNNRKYDFKSKGYWLRLNAGVNAYGYDKKYGNIELGVFNATYLPKNRYEKEREQGSILFKVSPEKAEKMIVQSNMGLVGYAVYKIKIEPNGIGSSSMYSRKKSRIDFIFHLLSPVVELYSDIELTNKIGEVSFENAIYK